MIASLVPLIWDLTQEASSQVSRPKSSAHRRVATAQQRRWWPRESQSSEYGRIPTTLIPLLRLKWRHQELLSRRTSDRRSQSSTVIKIRAKPSNTKPLSWCRAKYSPFWDLCKLHLKTQETMRYKLSGVHYATSLTMGNAPICIPVAWESTPANSTVSDVQRMVAGKLSNNSSLVNQYLSPMRHETKKAPLFTSKQRRSSTTNLFLTNVPITISKT